MNDYEKLERWVTIFFVLLVIGILVVLALYFYSNLDLESYCKSKNGIYEGDYVITNDCLIKEDIAYIRYKIERDDKNKPILVRE